MTNSQLTNKIEKLCNFENFTLAEILPTLNVGKQCYNSVLSGWEIIQNELIIRKETNRNLELSLGELEIINKTHNLYLKSLTEEKINFSNPIKKEIIAEGAQNRIIIFEKLYPRINLRTFLETQNDTEFFLEASKHIFKMMIGLLFSIKPAGNKTSTQLKVAIDYKPANFLLYRGKLLLIDTYGPKVWDKKNQKNLVEMPKIDSDFGIQDLSLLCGDVFYMTGRLYRIFFTLIEQKESAELAKKILSTLLKEKLRQNKIRFTEKTIKNFHSALKNNFQIVQNLYDRNNNNHKNYQADGI